ncbi:hypothetical protein D3C80_2165560 [compost metagenome]
MSKTRIVIKEGRCAEQHGAVTVVNQFRNHTVMQRAGVKEDAAAGHQRRQQPDRQAERVEKRQR